MGFTMIKQPTAQSFLKDVLQHQMHIKLDQGIFRHIEFKRQETNVNSFQITTTPYHLIITGDMGSYTFTRLNDMFEFFESGVDNINPSYWSEKVESVDRRCGLTTFSKELFDEAVKNYIEEYLDGLDIDQSELDDLNECIDSMSIENDYQAREALTGFKFELGDGETIEFTDVWEMNFSELSYHFVWCCYAIAWAIEKYNEAKNNG